MQICLECAYANVYARLAHGAARPLQRPNHKRHCVRTAADVAAAVQVAARTTPVDILVEARSMVEEDNLRSICGPRDLGESRWARRAAPNVRAPTSRATRLRCERT